MHFLVSAAGCGDPLVGERFRGKPVWSVPTDLQLAGDGQSAIAHLFLAIFFSPGGPDVLDPEKWIEFPASTTPVAGAQNVCNVFEEPGPAYLAHGPDGASLGYAVGRVLVYRDDSGDGRRQPQEALVGIDAPVAFLYAPALLPVEKTPTNGALEAGFRFIIVPQPCGKLPPGPTTPGNCGVPLGAACNSDQDCTGGTCIHQTNVPWRGGYCAIPEPPFDGCRPQSGVYLERPAFPKYMPGPSGYWVKRCRTSADCARTGPHNEIGYSCDPGLLGCVPPGPGVIPIGADFDLNPFCMTGPKNP